VLTINIVSIVFLVHRVYASLVQFIAVWSLFFRFFWSLIFVYLFAAYCIVTNLLSLWLVVVHAI